MKNFCLLATGLLLWTCCAAQRPSKEQMEADKKKFAEEMKKLNEQTAKMSPAAKKAYDSMLNSMGMGQKIDHAVKQVNDHQSAEKGGKTYNGLVPAKNNKAIAGLASTPSNANMGAYLNTTGSSTFTAVLPAAKNKATEIYSALKQKGATSAETGKAATVLWMQGRIQIALSIMAQVCKDDPANTDNLNNYASMLTMMGAPEMAIPILNNLNARFRKNSTILNNIGQAWFALGDMDKAKKYLDSTLIFAASHAQANETLCLIAESKGNKAAAVAYAKAAFRQGNTTARKNKLQQLGYTPGSGDYKNFPRNKKSDDLLNLGNFSPMEFPKSYASMKMYEKQWKIMRADIEQRLKPLQKATEESNKQMVRRLEEQQKQFMNARNNALADPTAAGSFNAMQLAGVPMFSERMNARQKEVMQNVQRKKDAAIKKIAEFTKTEGAAYRRDYEAAMKKISERSKNVGAGGTENNEALCNESVKTVDAYLLAYNSKLEDLYKEYLTAQKQFLNEFSYLSLYTTYSEMLPGINAGLKMQWLNDLAFKAEVLQLSYGCAVPGQIKNARLTEFTNPNCDFNDEFSQSLGLANLGFRMTLDCSGLTTEFNALIFGIKLNQDLDHAGFGDSFRNCTVSIGPKTGVDAKLGPLEASANVGAGVDIEIGRNGITDVVVKGSVEAELSVPKPDVPEPGKAGNPNLGSAGVEGSISLNTGATSINGTGIFEGANKK